MMPNSNNNNNVWEVSQTHSTVFIPTRSLPTFDKAIYGIDIVRAVDLTTGNIGAIECVQKVQGVWRVTVKNDLARAALLTRGISLRSHFVTVLGQNPFLSPDGKETLRLSISNIPYATSIEPLLHILDNLGVKLTTGLMPEYFREDNGKLMNVKTGRLFAYMTQPKDPLPRFVKLMKNHKVYLSYMGQEEELKRLESLEKEKDQQRDQSDDVQNENDSFQGNIQNQKTNQLEKPSDNNTNGTASFPSCAADTELLEDTPEPLPLTADSLGTYDASLNKPIAFDIPLSSTQKNIIKKRSKINLLKKKQLTLHEMNKRNKKSSSTPRISSNKRNFGDRGSPSYNTTQGSKSKASKTVSKKHESSHSAEDASLSVASERPA